MVRDIAVIDDLVLPSVPFHLFQTFSPHKRNFSRAPVALGRPISDEAPAVLDS